MSTRIYLQINVYVNVYGSVYVLGTELDVVVLTSSSTCSVV